MSEVRELQSENDIDTLLSLLTYQDDIKQRIKEDFNKSRFRGVYATSNSTTKWLGYIIFCDAYSTWQHRLLFCSDIYLNTILLDTKEKKLEVLQSLFETIIKLAQENKVNRVNLNISSETGQEMIDLVCELGAINLTAKEDWLIFQMGKNEMVDFSQLKTAELKSDYKLIKLEINNVSQYIDQVIDLIKEIAIFEKMLDQFETSKENLFRDFEYSEHKYKFNNYNDKVSSRFYELMVLVKGEKEVVGYSIYHLKYELKKGLGIYLEEIYMREEYRHLGLGTILWKRVIQDILTNYKDAQYMHWTCLKWNQPAIDFYQKFKSVDLNELEKIVHLRFSKDFIYSKRLI